MIGIAQPTPSDKGPIAPAQSLCNRVQPRHRECQASSHGFHAGIVSEFEKNAAVGFPHAPATGNLARRRPGAQTEHATIKVLNVAQTFDGNPDVHLTNALHGPATLVFSRQDRHAAHCTTGVAH